VRSYLSFSPLRCGAILLFSAFCVSAQPSWQLLGLADRSINCLLADDTTMILAGTDKGMSVYWKKGWYDFPIALPVNSILRYSSSVIFVGAGSGTSSDAVYIGDNIIMGPPFYALRFQQSFLEPTALALNNVLSVPRLYVGGRNIVSVGTIGADTLNPLQLLKMPSFAFGVESPKCAALFMFSSATLYAGGYDRGVMAAPGSHLVLSADSLQTIRRLNVTSLAQGSFGAGPVSQQQLVIGTRDTGVLLYEPVGQTWTAITSPNRLPVNNLIAVSSGMTIGSLIIAAFDSGVYTNNGRTQIWTEVGNIPAMPRCVAPRGTLTGSALQGALLAGTAAGVYIYALPASVQKPAPALLPARPAKPVVCRNNEVCVMFPQGFTSSGAYLAVYTAAGRLYRRVAVSGETALFRLEAKGLFYYRYVVGNKTARSGILLNM